MGNPQSKKKGLFITFEGGEGSGKSTQVKILAEKLQTKDIPLLLTREPGGTETGQAIRKLLLDSKNHHLASMTELLLYSADRFQHVSEKILPSLQKNIWVICDRFVDSTQVYQGHARGLKDSTVDFLCQLATQNLKPDLTFLLDLPPEIGLKRSQQRLKQQNSNESRFENEALVFHQKVREAFLKLSQIESKRFCVIDATQSIEEISLEIWQKIEKFV